MDSIGGVEIIDRFSPRDTHRVETHQLNQQLATCDSGGVRTTPTNLGKIRAYLKSPFIGERSMPGLCERTLEADEPRSNDDGYECGDGRRRNNRDLLSLLEMHSPEVLREHVVPFLTPWETSDLLSTDPLMAGSAAGTWRRRLDRLSSTNDNTKTEGGSQERSETATYWKDRFRKEYYMVRVWCGPGFKWLMMLLDSSQGHTYFNGCNLTHV